MFRGLFQIERASRHQVAEQTSVPTCLQITPPDDRKSETGLCHRAQVKIYAWPEFLRLWTRKKANTKHQLQNACFEQ